MCVCRERKWRERERERAIFVLGLEHVQPIREQGNTTTGVTGPKFLVCPWITS